MELAGLASMRRGEVRRLKKLPGLPKEYRKELLKELEKLRSEQILTVDHVLEATAAASALRKRDVLTLKGEDDLRCAIIKKFRTKVENNTVAPRLLTKLARGVHRNEVSLTVAKRVSEKLIEQGSYSISDAFRDSVEQSDFQHNLEQLVARLLDKLKEHERRGYQMSSKLLNSLKVLANRIGHLSEE